MCTNIKQAKQILFHRKHWNELYQILLFVQLMFNLDKKLTEKIRKGI